MTNKKKIQKEEREKDKLIKEFNDVVHNTFHNKLQYIPAGANVEFNKGYREGISKSNKGIKKIIKWLKGIVWCNGHDTAWIESTIEKLEALQKQDNNP